MTMSTKPSDPNQVLIFDTTLRDGEQSPGATMTIDEKCELARRLEALGVDIIEAGFPIASEGDFTAVHKIAQQSTRARIAGLARSVKRDIDRVAEAVAPAGDRGRIHLFLATSAIHREFKFGKAKDEILKIAVEHVRYAKSLCQDIEFSPEDASRTEPEFLAEVVQAVIEAGATTVNIPDTVGFAYPRDYADLIDYLNDHVANINEAVISVHCHNDLGLAVANSLAAVKRGARQIECTINGIGERAGNCALEEVVMAMRVRQDQFDDLHCGIKSELLYPTSRLVQSVTGLPIQRNKAIVGDNAFAHESGIHQDGVLKNPETYEIMTPAAIGRSTNDMVLGKHSGRHALADRLASMGFQLNDEEISQVFIAFKDLADRKKEVFDGDIIALIEKEIRGRHVSVWQLTYLNVSAGTEAIATATATLQRGDEKTSDAATGDGPVDAVIKVLDRICGTSGTVEDYRLRAVSAGRDAQGEVSIRVDFGTGSVGGKGLSTDVIEASCLAYLDAINRVGLLKQVKGDIHTEQP
jgi:2-isopropylmalate synthase